MATERDMAEATTKLHTFVNDHNEVVCWLRNQSPDEVAEALAESIAAERTRVQEIALGAFPESMCVYAGTDNECAKHGACPPCSSCETNMNRSAIIAAFEKDNSPKG